MKSASYMSTLAISLYVLLFLFAVWSAFPSSLAGSAAVSGVVEQQLAGCELGAGPVGAQREAQTQPKDSAGKVLGGWYSSWTGTGMQDAYSCALLTGASYN